MRDANLTTFYKEDIQQILDASIYLYWLTNGLCRLFSRLRKRESRSDICYSYDYIFSIKVVEG